MMKYLKFLLCFTACILLSGCVKVDYKMNINNDKSLDLNIFYGVENDETRKNEVEDAVKSLKDRGFIVLSQNQDNLKGYSISKRYDNIDSVSSEAVKSVIMTDIYKSKFDDTKLFNIDDQGLRKVYKATFIFDYSDIDSSNEDELSYTVTLPKEALSTNATSVSVDGKTLKWTFKPGEENIANFSFAYNNNIALFAIGGGIVLVIFGVIGAVVLSKNDSIFSFISKKSPIILPKKKENEIKEPNNIFKNNLLSAVKPGKKQIDTKKVNEELNSNTKEVTYNPFSNAKPMELVNNVELTVPPIGAAEVVPIAPIVAPIVPTVNKEIDDINNKLNESLNKVEDTANANDTINPTINKEEQIVTTLETTPTLKPTEPIVTKEVASTAPVVAPVVNTEETLVKETNSDLDKLFNFSNDNSINNITEDEKVISSINEGLDKVVNESKIEDITNVSISPIETPVVAPIEEPVKSIVTPAITPITPVVTNEVSPVAPIVKTDENEVNETNSDLDKLFNFSNDNSINNITEDEKVISSINEGLDKVVNESKVEDTANVSISPIETPVIAPIEEPVTSAVSPAIAPITPVVTPVINVEEPIAVQESNNEDAVVGIANNTEFFSTPTLTNAEEKKEDSNDLFNFNFDLNNNIEEKKPEEVKVVKPEDVNNKNINDMFNFSNDFSINKVAAPVLKVSASVATSAATVDVAKKANEVKTIASIDDYLNSSIYHQNSIPNKEVTTSNKLDDYLNNVNNNVNSTITDINPIKDIKEVKLDDYLNNINKEVKVDTKPSAPLSKLDEYLNDTNKEAKSEAFVSVKSNKLDDYLNKPNKGIVTSEAVINPTDKLDNYLNSNVVLISPVKLNITGSSIVASEVYDDYEDDYDDDEDSSVETIVVPYEPAEIIKSKEIEDYDDNDDDESNFMVMPEINDNKEVIEDKVIEDCNEILDDEVINLDESNNQTIENNENDLNSLGIEEVELPDSILNPEQKLDISKLQIDEKSIKPNITIYNPE